MYNARRRSRNCHRKPNTKISISLQANQCNHCKTITIPHKANKEKRPRWQWYSNACGIVTLNRMLNAFITTIVIICDRKMCPWNDYDRGLNQFSQVKTTNNPSLRTLQKSDVSLGVSLDIGDDRATIQVLLPSRQCLWDVKDWGVLGRSCI